MSIVYSGGTLRMTSKEEKQSETVKTVLYPNPVLETLYVSNENTEKIEIYNMSAVLVKTSQNNGAIDMSRLAPGTYFAKIYTSQGSFNQTIIKK